MGRRMGARMSERKRAQAGVRAHAGVRTPHGQPRDCDCPCDRPSPWLSGRGSRIRFASVGGGAWTDAVPAHMSGEAFVPAAAPEASRGELLQIAVIDDPRLLVSRRRDLSFHESALLDCYPSAGGGAVNHAENPSQRMGPVKAEKGAGGGAAAGGGACSARSQHSSVSSRHTCHIHPNGSARRGASSSNRRRTSVSTRT